MSRMSSFIIQMACPHLIIQRWLPFPARGKEGSIYRPSSPSTYLLLLICQMSISPVAMRWLLFSCTLRKVQLSTDRDGLTHVNLYFLLHSARAADMAKPRFQAKENRTVKEGCKVGK
jgi:hypothetical protein